MSVTVDDVRRLALSLPRTTEGIVRDSIRFRVGRLVYVAFSPDETVMEFACRRDERAGLVAGDPEKFQLPLRASDLRYNWVGCRLAALDAAEMRDLVVDAWAMVVPSSVSAPYAER